MQFQSVLLVFFSMYSKAEFKATSKFWKGKTVHSAALAGCKCTSQTVHDRSLNSIGEKTERD